ncbi:MULTISPECIES: GNAT family N-acetyltransferase [unclassified Fibrobacter]|uniref:GNAT family N-acetyltransferase n=1 Tax=unclassified Fibrobacter TaxID=2634177 RepID=UPI000D6B0289|nr:MULTISPECIES: GNAT family protein [unclassified Fibrobacter]PWJ62723.1 ribosomal-protein-serine acetyltransferase [Fibrobacter sp. UWR4]PZW66825.1 ribosomal-protein-serine acetyltransferase [Fibrobacter sp. UWR1]
MDLSEDRFEEEFTQAFSTETLEGTRVKLVGLGLRDAEESGRPMSADVVCRLVQESEDFLAVHLPWVRGVTVPEIAKRMRSWIFAEQYGQGGCWGIFPKDQPGNLAGFIMAEFNLKNRSATLSYWLSQKNTGLGFMTDSLKTLSRYCFDVLKLNRLELSVSVSNEKSLALATRCGFKKEGVNRDFERINGIFVDHCHFSLLARDVY